MNPDDPPKNSGPPKRSKPPEVVDLRRYKAVREKAARKPAPAPAPNRPAAGESFLGSRPRAGVILVVVVAVILALWLGPMLF